jgi:ABC-type multidrug transport system permease subunit
MDILTQLAAFGVSFIAIGLKAFQQKNVTGHHLKAVVVTSYLMTLMDVTFIGLVAHHGWDIALASGTGAALGMISAILLHNKFIGSRDA